MKIRILPNELIKMPYTEISDMEDAIGLEFTLSKKSARQNRNDLTWHRQYLKGLYVVSLVRRLIE